MVKIVYCVALITLSSAFASAYLNPLSDEYINNINNQQSSWKAGRNFDPDTPLSQLRSMLGPKKRSTLNKEVKTIHHVKDIDIPETFDARLQWPNCTSIKEIPDESACDASWAVITASAMSDRVCIASNGSSQLRVSATNILSCVNVAGSGCGGGVAMEAWLHWTKTGFVTGGPYNSSLGCQNYPFPNCRHYGNDTSLPDCPGDNYDTPDCVSTCDDPSLSYNDSLTYGDKYYLIQGSDEQTQLEIIKNGPIVTTFLLYNDFFSYKSGVYRRTSDDFAGAQSAKILGWGTENNLPYWLASISWNVHWGDNGTFKIIRGINECEIESDLSAGTPKL